MLPQSKRDYRIKINLSFGKSITNQWTGNFIAHTETLWSGISGIFVVKKVNWLLSFNQMAAFFVAFVYSMHLKLYKYGALCALPENLFS